MPLRKPTVSAADPSWVRELKEWMIEAADIVNSVPTRGDNRTAKVDRGAVTALPQAYQAVITGAVDGNGYFPCSVYIGGPASSSPLTNQLMKLRNLSVDGTVEATLETPSRWVVRPITETVSGTPTLVWDCVPGIPCVPVATEGDDNYMLASLEGVVQWVEKIPDPPDEVNDYMLVSLDGVLTWVSYFPAIPDTSNDYVLTCFSGTVAWTAVATCTTTTTTTTTTTGA
jgi:hypothetical protein